MCGWSTCHAVHAYPGLKGVSAWISSGSPLLSGCGLAARGRRRILGAAGMLSPAWMLGGAGVLWFDVCLSVTCRHAGLAVALGGGPAEHFCDTEAWLQGDAPVARMLLRDVGVGLPALMPSGPSLVRPGMMLADFTQGDAAHARVRARAEQDGLASGELAGALSRRNPGSLVAGVPCWAALALPSPFRRARGADRSRGLTEDGCGNGISRVACCRRGPRHGPCLGRSATCRSGVGLAALRCGAAEAVRRRRGPGHAAEGVLHLPRRDCCAGAGPGGGGPAGLGRLRRPGSWLSSVFRGHRGPDPSAICDAGRSGGSRGGHGTWR